MRVVVTLEDGSQHEAQVPSGASKGSYEALELRDGDKAAFGGKGVLKAVRNVNEVLGPAVIKSGLRPDQQAQIDDLLIKTDGSDDKSRLGANAILAISMAVARAGASVKVRTSAVWKTVVLQVVWSRIIASSRSSSGTTGSATLRTFRSIGRRKGVCTLHPACPLYEPAQWRCTFR